MTNTDPSKIPAYDAFAHTYEAWFDKSPGREIFLLELDCLRAVQSDFSGEWLEIGVGTGRFAEILGFNHGIDPSTEMLAFAHQRGVLAVEGVGEDLPYRDESLDGVVMITVLSFLSDAKRVFRETERVLRPGGTLVVSIVPRDSTWGRYYSRKGAQGNAMYTSVRFFNCHEVAAMARRVGLIPTRDACCLFCPGGENPLPDEQVELGINPSASFVTLGFVKPVE